MGVVSISLSESREGQMQGENLVSRMKCRGREGGEREEEQRGGNQNNDARRTLDSFGFFSISGISRNVYSQ